MLVLVVVEGLVIVVLGLLVAGLLRSHADILRGLHELGVGERALDGDAPGADAGAPFRTQPGVPEPRPGETPAAGLTGVSPTGSALHVGVVGASHSTLIAFLSTGCLTCRDFWDAFAAETSLPGRNTRLVIVTKGPEAESPPAVAALAPPGVTTLMSSEAWADHAVPVAPYFLLIDGPSGTVIGEGAAASWSQVSSLLHQALADTGRNPDGMSTPLSRATGAERAELADDALRSVGIGPGDPALYHTPIEPGGL